jgi:8-oxo-dGTP pyrophosphatase MutT (NUDIX family)
MEFEILARGLYRPEQVMITYDPVLRMPVDDAIQGWMDDLWQRKLAIAREKGVRLFDAPLFRLVKVETGVEGQRQEGRPQEMQWGAAGWGQEGRGQTELEQTELEQTGRGQAPPVHLILGDTSYKGYVTTREPEFFRGRRREELSNALGVCSVVETSDGYILLDRRQGVDVYAGRYHVIGGFFERGLDMGEQPDPFAAMRREIREETGIQAGDIHEQFCLGVVYDLATPHGELCFLTELNIGLAEVRRRVPEDDEVKELLALVATAEGLRDFVLSHRGNISATGEPNLLMYGAVRFGEGWFEEVVRRL